MSLVMGGSVEFLERRETLIAELRAARPTFFFGAPWVWEQLSHAILQDFGGREAFEAACLADRPAAVARARAFLGFQDIDSLLCGSAPISRSLLEFFEGLGFVVLEGFGQTEAMGLICTTATHPRLGSIGKPLEGVEAKITKEGELLVRAEGLSPGYFRDPERTAETFRDGWVHTGDRARVDVDGFYYITGRIKDYFKTIHGKFVAPGPIEDAFARLALVDQRCLLGRGFSKTVMVCTLSPTGPATPRGAGRSASGAGARRQPAGRETCAHRRGHRVGRRMDDRQRLSHHHAEAQARPRGGAIRRQRRDSGAGGGRAGQDSRRLRRLTR